MPPGLCKALPAAALHGYLSTNISVCIKTYTHLYKCMHACVYTYICVCSCVFRVQGPGVEVRCVRVFKLECMMFEVVFLFVCACVGACGRLSFRSSGLTWLGYVTSKHLVLDLTLLDEGSWLLIQKVRLHGSHMDRTARRGLWRTPLTASKECAA